MPSDHCIGLWVWSASGGLVAAEIPNCAAESKEMHIILFLSSLCHEMEFCFSKLGMIIFFWASMDSKFYVSLVSYFPQKTLPFASLQSSVFVFSRHSQRFFVPSLRKWSNLPDKSLQCLNAWGFFFFCFASLKYQVDFVCMKIKLFVWFWTFSNIF